MRKHTQGPWTFDSPDIRGWVMKGDVYLLEIADEDEEGLFIDNYEERKANGYLAAAAPDMLDALEGAQAALRKAMPFLPADGEAVYCGEWLGEICAAIAKAKGEAEKTNQTRKVNLLGTQLREEDDSHDPNCPYRHKGECLCKHTAEEVSR